MAQIPPDCGQVTGSEQHCADKENSEQISPAKCPPETKKGGKEWQNHQSRYGFDYDKPLQSRTPIHLCDHCPNWEDLPPRKAPDQSRARCGEADLHPAQS